MADSRTSRDLSSRDKSARIVYTPSSTLPDPTPEPGYTYRWIATHVLGQSTPTNVSAKQRDGWVPVKAADHEELMLVGNEKTGNVEVGGLMLCKMPTERAQAIADYYNQTAQANMESVDNNFMRQQDPRMATLFSEKRSTVTRGNFGSGSK
jgi:hypothetical protein